MYIKREKQDRSWRKAKLDSDHSLVEKFHNGDDHAFSKIYVRYRNVVFAIALGVLRSRDDAEDVMQEVFATAAKYLSTTTPDNLKAWFARVTRNSAIDHLRARKQTVEMNESHERTSREEPHHLLERRNAVNDMVRYLSVLPETQRTALLLRELTGGSYVEISQTLGMDPETVGNLIKRARVALRAQRSGESLGCPVVRDQLATELDRRKLSTELRFHIRACRGCRDFDRGLRSDRKAIRALLPALPLISVGDDAFGMDTFESTPPSAKTELHKPNSAANSGRRAGMLIATAAVMGLLHAVNLNDGVGTEFDVQSNAGLSAARQVTFAQLSTRSSLFSTEVAETRTTKFGETTNVESSTSPVESGDKETSSLAAPGTSSSTASPTQTPSRDNARQSADRSSKSITEALASKPTEATSTSHVGSQSATGSQSENTPHSGALEGTQDTSSNEKPAHGGLVPNYKPPGLSPGNTGPPSGTSGTPTGTLSGAKEKPSGIQSQSPSDTPSGTPQATTPETTQQKPSGGTTTKTTSGTSTSGTMS